MTTETIDVDRLALAIAGIGVIDSGAWVSFRRADAEQIAHEYAHALDCIAGPPHESVAMKTTCPDCIAGHETHEAAEEEPR